MSTHEPHEDPRLPVLKRIRDLARQDVRAERVNGKPKPFDRAVSDQDLIKHLTSVPALDVYIMPWGRATQLAVFDLDNHHPDPRTGKLYPWAVMMKAGQRVMKSAHAYGLHFMPERSGGGNGIHLWCWWDAPQDARSVRLCMESVLADAGFEPGNKGVVAGTVEVFPKSDQIKPGGYGNCCALPFARESVPLDEMLEVADAPLDWPASNPVPIAPARKEEPRTNGSKPNVETVRAALVHVPSDDRDLWIKVGYALKHECGDEGFELWNEWSSKSGKYDAEDADKVWDSLSPDGSVTLGTVFHEAKKNGWRVKKRDQPTNTDVGNAERLVALHGEDMRYCYAGKEWLIWDGCRYRKDDNGEAHRRAKTTAANIYDEARVLDMSGIPSAKAVAQWAQTSESRDRIKAMLEMAQSDLPVMVDELDSNNDVLNLLNGTMDLRTFTHREHDRADLCTKVAPVIFDALAQCPRWLKFLERIYAGDQALIAFVQRAVGYSLTGSTEEQVFFLLHGEGSNGKSTFLDVVTTLLGDYARPADFKTFLHSESDAIRNDLAGLAGVRMVMAIEASEGKRLDEALVKQMTGGDKISARFLYKEFFDFRPKFKLWLAANDKPEIRGLDEAIWRRVMLIPHEVTIQVEERDPKLVAKLKEELPGILNWALAGLREWREKGLAAPPRVSAATGEYRQAADLLRAFLEMECEVDKTNHQWWTSTAELYARYEKCSVRNGEQAVKNTTFGKLLNRHHFVEGQKNNKKGRFGVRLKPEGVM